MYMSLHGPRPTVFLQPDRLSERFGVNIWLAVETFQHGGSFKFRAAWNVANSVPNSHLVTASSGNFGQALALAAKLVGKRCTVVMPETSAVVKIDAVRGHGAIVDLIDTHQITREARVAQVVASLDDAYVASPFDDPLVIAGNASLGREIAHCGTSFDSVFAPIGGGGLAAGLIVGLREAGSLTPVIAAEPLLGNDAARSMREGRIVANESEPLTLADGARTRAIGRHNWEVLQHGLKDVIEVPEDQIRAALRSLFFDANLKSEPTGTLGLAAVMTDLGRFQGQTVCCVVTGGNVDSKTYSEIIDG
jgi:threonine dehydratase